MIYRYDGTFAGLLSLFAVVDGRDVELERIERPPFADGGLFDDFRPVATDLSEAGRVRLAILQRIGPRSLATIRLAYLSEQPGIELHLFGYLGLGWKVGAKLDSYMVHPDVHAVQVWSRRTAREAHRMKGFVRFRELSDGSFYAPIQPDTNVVPLIARHFAARMDRSWLLHDVRRGLGAMGENGSFVLGEIREDVPPEYTADEQTWQGLWRTFHQSIAIESRRNLSLQRQFMPLKYRDFLVECDPDVLSA